MSPESRIRLSATTLSLLTFVVCGCSVINPHLKLSKTKQQQYISCVDLDCATKYANEWRERYHSAAGDDSILRNSVAMGIIPLSALALYRGVTSSSNSRDIAALGIGAASLYTAGNFLHSTARQKVYISGSQAIGCALVAVEPLRIPQTASDALIKDTGDLEVGLTDTDSALRVLQAWLQQASQPGAVDPDELASANAEYAAAQATRTDAQQVFQSAIAYETQLHQAGYALKVAVDAIRDEVDSKVTDTEPDLQSVLNAASGLGKLASSFEPTANLSAPPASPPKVGETIKGKAPTNASVVAGIKKARNDLQATAQKLVDAANAVRLYLNEAATSKVTEAISACKVADVDTGFHVTPDTDKQTLGANQSLRFSVTSDSGIPRVSRAGADVLGVDLSSEIEQGSFVAVVHAGASTPGGTFQLVITDGTGKNQKSITITVTKSGTTPAPTQPRPTPPPNQAQTQPYTTGQMAAIQKALNDNKIAVPPLTVDGKAGVNTVAAIDAYQKSLNHPQNGVLTQSEFLGLVGSAVQTEHAPPAEAPLPPAETPPTTSTRKACPATPANDFEKNLDKATIGNLQTALGLPVAKRSGVLDAPTRSSIQRFSKASGEAPDEQCLLSADKVKAILAEK